LSLVFGGNVHYQYYKATDRLCPRDMVPFKGVGFVGMFYVFERSLLCLPRLHLFDHTVNTVKTIHGNIIIIKITFFFYFCKDEIIYISTEIIPVLQKLLYYGAL